MSSCADDLVRTEKGQLRATEGNALLILDNDERLHVFGWNEHGYALTLRKRPPWCGPNETREFPCALRDDDLIRLAGWIQKHYEGAAFGSKKFLEAALYAAARQFSFDPVREYLERAEKRWDQVERCNDWLIDYFGAENTVFVRAVAVRWLISAVARVFEPGCQADYTLVFEGLQGKGKSSALRVLAGQWFKDEVLSMDSREGPIALTNTWIWEIGELASFRKNQIESVKSFLTRVVDRFREMFGRHPVERPRRCVFAASTNEFEYLTDPTGNRRFWPVRCTAIDLEGLRACRDQLWGEAVARYRRGEPWHFEKGELEALAEIEVEQRFERDLWEDELEDWAAERDKVTVVEAFKALGMRELDILKLTKPEQARMGGIIRRLGFTDVEKPRNGRSRKRVYHRPKVEEPPPLLRAVNGGDDARR